MVVIRRPVLACASAASLLVLLIAASSRAADTEKPPVRSTMPSHLSAPANPAKDPPRVRPASRHASQDKVNINTADVKTLMTLTGVSRKVAEKIVEYRDTHGPFKKVDELRRVDGVGTGVWEKNRERVVTR